MAKRSWWKRQRAESELRHAPKRPLRGPKSRSLRIESLEQREMLTVLPTFGSIGQYDTQTGTWYLRYSNTSGNADNTFGYGPAPSNWTPVVGDWNNDGIDTIGLYDSVSSSWFYLRDSNSTGAADSAFGYGAPGWLPVTGDWDGDGDDTIGLYDPVDSLFYLRNTNNAGSADIYVSFGQGGAGLKPVAGDWNGDGIDTVGLYNPATGVFSLTNYPQGGDLTPFAFGAAGGIPIVGDWNRDGIDSIGVFQASTAQYSLRNSNTAGSADYQFGFGTAYAGSPPRYLPIAGHWTNLLPTMNTISSPAAINEDAGQQVVNLSGITAGAGESQTLRVIASSANTSLIPHPTVNYTSPNGTGSLSYTPVANQSGSTSIWVAVDDAGPDGILGTVDDGRRAQLFYVTVNPVNDAPTLDTISNRSVSEDAGLQTVNLSGITAGGGESQTLQVTATSSNTALIPHPTVNYTSPNSTGSLSFTPVANASGTSVITVTVRDAGLDLVFGNGDDGTTQRTFTVTVNAVNDPPTLNTIPNPAAIQEDSGQQVVNLSGISAGGGESQSLQVTAVSSNTALIPNPTVTYTSPNSTGSLSYTPVANASGTSVITVTVRDAGLDLVLGNGDDGTTQRTFTVTVNAVNDLPTLDVIANPAAINEDSGQQVVNLSGISAGGGESQSLQVTAVSSNTALIPNPTVTYTSPNSTGSLSFTPVVNASGTSVITVTVRDAGLDLVLGNGDDGTAQRTFTVTVNAVNDPPTLNTIPNPPAIQEDSGQQVVSLSGISAGGGESQSLQVTAVSSNTSLILNPTVTYTSPNSTVSLSYTPVSNASGTSVITVTVRDAGLDLVLGNGDDGTTQQAFTVSVNAVNDLPTLDVIANPAAINEDSGQQVVSLSAISAGGGESQSLQVTAVSSNTALIPNPAVTYVSPNNTGSLSYTPVADQSGTSVIMVTVRDAGLDLVLGNGDDGTTQRTFTVTVNAVNDAPVLDASGTMSLATILRDETSNPGTLVSTIIQSAGGDRITDADPNPLEGIAVIAADAANGAWEYSTDSGANWNSMGSPTESCARLLAADAATRVRFVPAAGWNGTVASGLTFRAWDQTTGAGGGTGDATVNGGSTAFSSATETASIRVDAPPTLTAISALGGQEDLSLTITYQMLADAADEADIDSPTISFRVESVVSGTLLKRGRKGQTFTFNCSIASRAQVW